MASPVNFTCKFRALLHFVNDHVDFRIAELTSVANMLGIPICFPERERDDDSPFVEVQLPSADSAVELMRRPLLVRSAYELWASASNHNELLEKLSQEKELCMRYKNSDRIKMDVITFGKNDRKKEKIEKIEKFLSSISLNGSIDLTQPLHTFAIFEYYKRNVSNHLCRELGEVRFGRWLASGQRHLMNQYSLKERYFIGNTSMDATLAAVMANIAQVQPASLVFDPFVGTGSLLVASAHFGAFVLGADIDFQLVHGQCKPSRPNCTRRASDESIRTNLKKYGLESLYVDVLVSDVAKCVWKNGQALFDVIIADPPYGVREKAVKVTGRKKPTAPFVESPETIKYQHYPGKSEYELNSVLVDLVNFAARKLVVGGRLAFWLPCHKPSYSPDQVPNHPAFKLVYNCEQSLSAHISRRLITMEKLSEVCGQGDDATIMSHSSLASFRKMYFTPSSDRKQHDDSRPSI